MSQLITSIEGLISIAKSRCLSPSTRRERDWSEYDRPALERVKKVDLDQWRERKMVVSPRPLGPLASLI